MKAEWIDCHVHLPMARICPLERVPDVMDAAAHAGIHRMWNLGDVMRYGYHPSAAQIRDINDSTVAVQRLYGDRLAWLCFLNPENAPDFLRAEMTRCFAAGCIGVKLEASVLCDDSRLEPILEFLAPRRGILLQHSWILADGGSGIATSLPAHVARMAAKAPAVRIVMAHLTGIGKRGVMDIADSPNVRIDTSGGQPVAGLVEFAVEHLGAERVLYGSDAPGRDFASQVGRITGSRLAEPTLAHVCGGNAARLEREVHRV